MQETSAVLWAPNGRRTGKEPRKELMELMDSMEETDGKELCRHCEVNGMELMEETGNGIYIKELGKNLWNELGI